MFAGRGRSPWRWSLWKEGKGRAIDAVASWRPQAAHPELFPSSVSLLLSVGHSTLFRIRALSSPPDENPLRRQSCALLSRRWALRSGRVLRQEVAWIVTVSRTRGNQRRTLVKESRSAHSGLAGSPAPPLPSAFPREQVGTALPKVPAQGGACSEPAAKGWAQHTLPESSVTLAVQAPCLAPGTQGEWQSSWENSQDVQVHRLPCGHVSPPRLLTVEPPGWAQRTGKGWGEALYPTRSERILGTQWASLSR